jgi:hypothetical protein
MKMGGKVRDELVSVGRQALMILIIILGAVLSSMKFSLGAGRVTYQHKIYVVLKSLSFKILFVNSSKV